MSPLTCACLGRSRPSCVGGCKDPIRPGPPGVVFPGDAQTSEPKRAGPAGLRVPDGPPRSGPSGPPRDSPGPAPTASPARRGRSLPPDPPAEISAPWAAGAWQSDLPRPGTRGTRDPYGDGGTAGGRTRWPRTLARRRGQGRHPRAAGRGVAGATGAAGGGPEGATVGGGRDGGTSALATRTGATGATATGPSGDAAAQGARRCTAPQGRGRRGRRCTGWRR